MVHRGPPAMGVEIGPQEVSSSSHEQKQQPYLEWEMFASKILLMVPSEMCREDRSSSVNLLIFCIKSFTLHLKDNQKERNLIIINIWATLTGSSEDKI